MSAVAIDIDEDDVTSSLNTLLDTRPDRGSSSSRHPAVHTTDRLLSKLFFSTLAPLHVSFELILQNVLL